MPVADAYVLDAFALIGFFKSEPGIADTMESLFRRAARGEVRLVAATVNVGELYYRTIREFSTRRALEVLAQFEDYTVDIVPVDWPLALDGAALKGVYRISYADCIAAALAQRLAATLVTGDPDFEQIPGLRVEWLSQAG
ncbi:MAG: type II toxin-antitoxin system VapC family toxin [Dehalococcoidia bacterium]|nr:type II toxin-antitoxin system VapC family toxin [Dehalococcoidia bacterium]